MPHKRHQQRQHGEHPLGEGHPAITSEGRLIAGSVVNRIPAPKGPSPADVRACTMGTSPAVGITNSVPPTASARSASPRGTAHRIGPGLRRILYMNFLERRKREVRRSPSAPVRRAYPTRAIIQPRVLSVSYVRWATHPATLHKKLSCTGPGLYELPRIRLRRTSENTCSTHSGE